MPLVSRATCIVAIFFSGLASADTSSYGSFKHHAEVPKALFLTGAIAGNDSFELRRAMRNHSIELIVAASPGGSLYEGLQIAAILHDNGVATYIPPDGSCESSCANIFFGGAQRLVMGDLGVHQFYDGGTAATDAAPRDVTTAVTQYTTAEIIGIMNQFDTPPFVYERMFATTDIYYFTEVEKVRLNRGVDADAFLDQVQVVNDFLASSPEILSRQENNAAKGGPTNLPSRQQPATAPPPQSIEEMAASLLVDFNADWSLSNEHALSRIARYYASTVDFYGAQISHGDVMSDKRKFAERWPLRSYSVDPYSVRISCEANACFVDSVIAWSASSPARGAHASGLSTWTLLLMPYNGSLAIVSEGGKTFKRN